MIIHVSLAPYHSYPILHKLPVFTMTMLLKATAIKGPANIEVGLIKIGNAFVHWYLVQNPIRQYQIQKMSSSSHDLCEMEVSAPAAMLISHQVPMMLYVVEERCSELCRCFREKEERGVAMLSL